jgi:hypothetical protein
MGAWTKEAPSAPQTDATVEGHLCTKMVSGGFQK